MRWGAIAVLGGMGFVAFLSFATGARLDVATGGLVVGGAALVFSLATLFKMVQALSRPRAALGLSSRGLGGASRSQLREEKRRLLRAIKELKFDFEMGKLSEPDFTDVKQTYELRAVEVMRELDGARRVHPEVHALLEERGLTSVLPDGAVAEDATGETSPSEEDDAEASGEKALASPTPAKPNPSEGTLDNVSGEVGTQACGSCSGANDPDAKFCKHCGKEISA
ncbi:MAG: hypothetical protein KUG77_23075 [Nannocystaceae bacterium]|nr:hypothetical protein [Nannocystaceae bacterium]